MALKYIELVEQVERLLGQAPQPRPSIHNDVICRDCNDYECGRVRTCAKNFVVIESRTHDGDVSGTIALGDHGYQHLKIPMTYDPEQARTDRIWQAVLDVARGS